MNYCGAGAQGGEHSRKDADDHLNHELRDLLLGAIKVLGKDL